jgi:hypothetical protein
MRAVPLLLLEPVPKSIVPQVILLLAFARFIVPPARFEAPKLKKPALTE